MQTSNRREQQKLCARRNLMDKKHAAHKPPHKVPKRNLGVPNYLFVFRLLDTTNRLLARTAREICPTQTLEEDELLIA